MLIAAIRERSRSDEVSALADVLARAGSKPRSALARHPSIPFRRQDSGAIGALACLRSCWRKKWKTCRQTVALSQNGDLAVYLGTAQEMPQLLQEVGRLRELTFRGAGEGTGKSRDLDPFDDYYRHILLWHKAKHELVGAYRAGNTAEILAERGIKGLYTSTLFRFDERIFQKLGPALELGRSFVRPEYQRQYAPLLLLWKGIARLVARQPEIPVLFGAVSISNDYNEASREMIYRFFEARMQRGRTGGIHRSRVARFAPPYCEGGTAAACFMPFATSKSSLSPSMTSSPTARVYRFCCGSTPRSAANFWASMSTARFSNVLDGLVVVDLRQTEPAVLERYMGRDAATRFRHVHAAHRCADYFRRAQPSRIRAAAHRPGPRLLSASSRFRPRIASSSGFINSCRRSKSCRSSLRMCADMSLRRTQTDQPQS